MRKTLCISVVLFVTAIVVVSMLQSTSDDPNERPHGFNRRILPTMPVFKGKVPVPSGYREICGGEEMKVWLAGPIPGQVCRVDFRLLRYDTFSLTLPPIRHLASVFYTHVHYPKIFILGGNCQTLVEGNLKNKEYAIHRLDTGPFTNGTAISRTSFIMRAIDTATHNAVFRKIDLNNNSIYTAPVILENRRDFGMQDDGQLTYDAETGNLLYTCYYHNTVLNMDSGLRLIRRFNTIDSFSTGHIQIRNTGHSVSLAVPPVVVNRVCRANGGLLFVQSLLKADNEDKRLFLKNAVIDCYVQSTGLYAGSFYLPLSSGEKIADFTVSGNIIFLLHESAIATFTLPKIID